MKPHKIIVERHDTCMVGLYIRTKQPDGWYEYIPCGGDKITVCIKDKHNELVHKFTQTTPPGNDDRITLNFPTDLPEGKYTYDVILESGPERHTICDENIYEIKEGDAYEKLVR
ncbi:MAG: hypothetical protein MJ095_02250 [Oscillospiraceae bacterium]|nr:hypothetical protein [Oscillospiraceae bacterium]